MKNNMDTTIEEQGVRIGDWIFYDDPRYSSNVVWSPLTNRESKSPAERMKSAQKKYVNRYERSQQHKANNFAYRPTLKPSKKYGQLIRSGFDATDTVQIGVAIFYLGKWQTDWKLGFHPDIECEWIRFKFADGDLRRLHYRNVWQYIQDNFVNLGIEPLQDPYEGLPSKYYRVSFPALEAYDLEQSGVTT